MTTTTPKTTTPKPPTLAFVAPATAEKWLETNTENRNIRNTQVNALARDMAAGNWQITGDPVKFDTRGVLIDGQHRLWAIIESGVTVPLFVMRDLPTTVRDVIDTNVTRSAADVLRFEGTHGGDLVALAAAARIGLMKQNGGFVVATDWPPTWKYTNSEVQEFLTENPAYEQMIPRARASHKAIGISSRALWDHLLVTLDAVDADAAAEFERTLVEMETKGAGDPRATLLKWLRDARESRLSRAIMPRTMFAVYRTWNTWREGKSLSKIQINDGALIPEPI